MQGKHPMTGPRPVPCDAAEWCARLHSDQVTPSDRVAFAEWLSEHPDNRADYEKNRKLMRMSAGLAAYPDLEAALGLDREVPAAAATSWFRKYPGLVAASLFGVLALGVLITLWQGRAVDYATLIGERRTVTLEDGSVIDLNTDTRLDVAFDGEVRQLSLEKGEAFFDVTRDAGRPFVVATGQGEIHVVGTRFNVRAEGDETIVTVLEGKVRVQGRRADGGRDYALLQANDQIRFNAAGQMQRKSGEDLAQVAAWRRGQVYFDNATLAEVLDEFNRYSPRKYVLADAQLTSLRLSGVFRAGDMRALMFVLRESFGIVAAGGTGDVVELVQPEEKARTAAR